MGLVVALVIIFGVMGIAVWHVRKKDAARQALMAKPLPEEWLGILEGMTLYNRVPEELREKLHGFVQVFISEKRFEGCGGQKVTDEIRVTVAGLACAMILGHNRRVYPKLETVLVYPGAYLGHGKKQMSSGAVSEGDVRAGESWMRGPVIIAWDEAQAEARGEIPGHNVILHEFAHQLDQEDGFADGQPGDSDEYQELQDILAEEFEDAAESYE